MLASHTALIIHLHQMLQLQHKLQQHDFENFFGPVPRTFRCVSELLSDYIFFMIKSKNKRPSISSWHFIFILKILLLRNLAMNKMGQSGTLTIFLQKGPLGALKPFFFIHDFASTTKRNHLVNILFQRVFFIVVIFKYAYECSTMPHPIHYKTELSV